MKLTTFLVSAVLALGVAAVDPEAGNDVEVRDFSDESLNEFNARDEEEFDVRDEQDLEARGGYPKCKGSNVEWKKVDYDWKCVCTRSGEYYDKWKGCICKDGYEYSETYHKCIPICKDYEKYNPVTGKCEKPFYCKGKHVEIVDNYGVKSCKCTREGEKYSEKYGCKCDYGYVFSDRYHKCIPICKDYEKYNPVTGKCEKPFYCKGKNVEIVDNYGVKSCKCLLEGQVYNKWRGCECKDGEYFSKEYKKCIPKCSYGTKYNGKECAPICKGDYVVYKHHECKCLKPGFYYDESYGCKPLCPPGTSYDWRKKECKCDTYGQVYDKEHKKCYTPCKGKYVELKWENYAPTCVCTKEGYEYTKWGCKPVCKAPATLQYGRCTCPGDQKYNQHKGCYCPWGLKYDSEHKRCYKPCGKNEKLIWNYGRPKCVCKDGYVPTKWGCQKKHDGGYY